jgi:hypothetical protein
VLAVGQKHSHASEQEAYEQEMRERSLHLAQNKEDSRSRDVTNDSEGDEDDNDDIDDVNSKQNRSKEMYEHDGHSRDAIRLLISLHPLQLITQNNFFATPVDTIMEKTRPKETKKKKVSVFGLYNDPPTARILLAAHNYYSNIGTLPKMTLAHFHSLKELNWLVRKDAIFISLQFEKQRISKKNANIVGGKKSGKKDSSTINNSNSPLDLSQIETKLSNLSLKGESNGNFNILAMLRFKGELDCLRICISFI